MDGSHTGFSRIQLDFVKMENDGEYHYVGFYGDHWSKTTILFPLKAKTGEEVAENSERLAFAYYGPPSLLQTDNGTEFQYQASPEFKELCFASNWRNARQHPKAGVKCKKIPKKTTTDFLVVAINLPT